mmetsp:Transcript_52399/g.126811  ORF Transcript_52399/g.126811 Transcript_52399/m.126811 type:complete len:691 (-) Transcript_52399:1138-3210(-)
MVVESSRALRKRPASSDEALVGSGSSARISATTLLTNYEPPTQRLRRDVLSCELETAQAELEHERSLRLIDEKRFQQTKQRLEKQIEFAVEEAKEAKSLMEEMQVENERHLSQQKRARSQLQEELRRTQDLLAETEMDAADKADEEDPRIEMLQESLDAQQTENMQLKEKIQQMQQDFKELSERQKSLTSSADSGTNQDTVLLSHGASSEARPAVIKELNRVRIELAESERKNRQQKRQIEELQRANNQNVQEKEIARSATKRAEQLESTVQKTTERNERLSAELTAWKDFGRSVIKELSSTQETPDPSSSSSSSGVPPDMSMVAKWIHDIRIDASEHGAEYTNMVPDAQYQQAKGIIQKLEDESRSFQQNESSWKREKKELEKKITSLETNVTVLKGQQSVLKKEMEQLRGIIKTFDDLPPPIGSPGAANFSQPSAQVRMDEARLSASQQEISVLKDGMASLQRQLDTAVAEMTELQETHYRVLAKFEKLKTALYGEREKSEMAEARANRAELLAGKGSFNPDQTRVMRISKNPLTEALKEEVNVLRRQIEHLQSTASCNRSKNSSSKSQGADVDPNKLHQRLKQSFREQISRFREGVALMTGLRVEMIPGDNDRCKFKVKSIYADRESDHLMFQWPEGENVTSLDLLNTEQAKVLSKSPSYQYIEKFHSLPAFMASVQLALFETQTIM